MEGLGLRMQRSLSASRTTSGDHRTQRQAHSSASSRAPPLLPLVLPSAYLGNLGGQQERRALQRSHSRTHQNLLPEPGADAALTPPAALDPRHTVHCSGRPPNVRHERQTQAAEGRLGLSARWRGYAQPNDEASASAGRPRSSSASLPANSKGGRAAVADALTAAVLRACNDVRLAATHCRSRPASRASRAQRLGLGRAPALRARVTSPRRSSTEDSAHDEARAHNVRHERQTQDGEAGLWLSARWSG